MKIYQKVIIIYHDLKDSDNSLLDRLCALSSWEFYVVLPAKNDFAAMILEFKPATHSKVEKCKINHYKLQKPSISHDETSIHFCWKHNTFFALIKSFFTKKMQVNT